MVLNTGAGVWSPIIWLIALVIALAVSYYFIAGSSLGVPSTGDKGMPFLSGNPETEKQHMKASNIYWGFLEALKGYYKLLEDIHTGLLSDYVFWFLGAVVVSTLIVFI